MIILYERFKRLCEERGVVPFQVAKATGIAPSTFYDWKAGRARPKADKMYKIAKFFGVPVTVFIEGEGE